MQEHLGRLHIELQGHMLSSIDLLHICHPRCLGIQLRVEGLLDPFSFASGYVQSTLVLIHLRIMSSSYWHRLALWCLSNLTMGQSVNSNYGK